MRFAMIMARDRGGGRRSPRWCWWRSHRRPTPRRAAPKPSKACIIRCAASISPKPTCASSGAMKRASPTAPSPGWPTTSRRAGLELEFAMNGGMYGVELRPIGLLIEEGRELRRANMAESPAGVSPVPNFYKKPNGVFYIGEGEAGVMEMGRFVDEAPAARFATQSGPLLVIDGASCIPPSSRARATAAAQRRRRQQPHDGAFRHLAGAGELPRLRPLLPRPPGQRQRALSRRRLGARALFAAAAAQRPPRPRRLRADHRRRPPGE
jgi:hypothetical protein